MSLQRLKAGFAKLHGEDFEYFIQSYSIVLGRNSKKATVDVDLASAGATEAEKAGMNISRSHARIYFDFDSFCFMMEVLGKNGVTINKVLKEAGCPPVPLASQDEILIGDKRFYFLMPPAADRALQYSLSDPSRRRRSSSGLDDGHVIG